MSVQERPLPGGSCERQKAPSDSGNTGQARAPSSSDELPPAPSGSPQAMLSQRNEQPAQTQEPQQQPPASHGVSGLSKFLAVVFGPLIHLFSSIYNLFSPRIRTPEAAPPPQQHQAANMTPLVEKSSLSKENLNPNLGAGVANLTLRDAAAPIFPPVKPAILPFLPTHAVDVNPKEVEGEHPSVKVEREIHRGFIEQALDMARLALRTNETPVGCVLVCNGRVVAKGMNATNITRNGTRHAEYMALASLLAFVPGAAEPPGALQPASNGVKGKGKGCCGAPLDLEDDAVWDAVDPTRGHIYPYGQKLHPYPRVDVSIVRDCTLYVTVEPCVMCASMLRQLGIKKVFFGAVNDKFGGTGGVFRIHMNSPAARDDIEPMRRVMSGQVLQVSRNGTKTPLKPVALPEDIDTEDQATSNDQGSAAAAAPSSEANTSAPTAVSKKGSPPTYIRMGVSEIDQKKKWVLNKEPVVEPPRGAMRREGDGGNVEPGYEAEGGWGRDEAVALLRQFYVQENGRAPVPRKKEGRAARLAAMMERDGMNPSIDLVATAAMASSASAPVTAMGTPMPAGQQGGSSEPLKTNGDSNGGMAGSDDGGQEKDNGYGIIDVPTSMSDIA